MTFGLVSEVVQTPIYPEAEKTVLSQTAENQLLVPHAVLNTK